MRKTKIGLSVHRSSSDLKGSPQNDGYASDPHINNDMGSDDDEMDTIRSETAFGQQQLHDGRMNMGAMVAA